MTRRGPLFTVVLVGVVMILLALVLAPTSSTASGPVRAVVAVLHSIGAPGWLATTDLWEPLFNVLLFIPVGVAGVLVCPGWGLGRWIVVGLLLSGSIELAQGLLLPGRDAAASDVVANTAGTVLGAWATARLVGRARAL